MDSPTVVMIATADSVVRAAVEPLLSTEGAMVRVESGEGALVAMKGSRGPSLVLLDSKLPGMAAAEWLAASAEAGGKQALVLISDTVSQEWLEAIMLGQIVDVIPRTADGLHWQIRMQAVLGRYRAQREIESLRAVAKRNEQFDRLTGVYNRETLLGILFRETDRVQRMHLSLSLVLFDVDDFCHWNARLGGAACDELLGRVAARAAGLLRSYDLLGRTGSDEFLVALPGCNVQNAVMLAERLRHEVFERAYRLAGETVRLSASFGIATSHGRSPVVVLREAEQALRRAREKGAETIECSGRRPETMHDPVTFFSPATGDKLLAW